MERPETRSRTTMWRQRGQDCPSRAYTLWNCWNSPGRPNRSTYCSSDNVEPPYLMASWSVSSDRAHREWIVSGRGALQRHRKRDPTQQLLNTGARRSLQRNPPKLQVFDVPVGVERHAQHELSRGVAGAGTNLPRNPVENPPHLGASRAKIDVGHLLGRLLPLRRGRWGCGRILFGGSRVCARAMSAPVVAPVTRR